MIPTFWRITNTSRIMEYVLHNSIKKYQNIDGRSRQVYYRIIQSPSFCVLMHLMHFIYEMIPIILFKSAWCLDFIWCQGCSLFIFYSILFFRTKIAFSKQSKCDLISKTFISFLDCHIVMISFQTTPKVICEEFKETVHIGLIVFSSNYRV